MRALVCSPPVLDVCLLTADHQHQTGDHGEVEGGQGLQTNTDNCKQETCELTVARGADNTHAEAAPRSTGLGSPLCSWDASPDSTSL